MLGHRRFFLEGQVAEVEELIRTTYDLAKFWKADPQEKMDQPVSVIAEELDHAMRIVSEQQRAME